MSKQELLAALRRDLADLDRYAAEVSYDRFLRERDAQNMVLFAVYRVAQDLIDLANLIVAERSLGVPHTYREAFQLMSQAGLLAAPLAASLEGWVGLRNIIAHIYRKLDLDTLHAAMLHEREPLRSFLAVAGQLLLPSTEKP
ncbi:MAG: type VII toxin-antitoxin system HepT family RNase toxin [Myxococcota bacterium]